MRDKTKQVYLYSAIFSIICLLVLADVGLANHDTNGDGINDTMEFGSVSVLDISNYDPGPGNLTYGDTQWINLRRV